MVECKPWSEASARSIIESHAAGEGGLLPALHALQDAFGYITDDAIRLLAEMFNLTRADVFGVVTFYHDFRRHPPGRHVLKVCRAEACQALGGQAVEQHVRQTLGVDWHGTTADGGVSLDPVFCLGLCASGPSAMLDGKPHGRMTPEKADRLIGSLV